MVVKELYSLPWSLSEALFKIPLHSKCDIYTSMRIHQTPLHHAPTGAHSPRLPQESHHLHVQSTPTSLQPALEGSRSLLTMPSVPTVSQPPWVHSSERASLSLSFLVWFQILPSNSKETLSSCWLCVLTDQNPLYLISLFFFFLTFLKLPSSRTS